jgi:hypothetical protein
LSLLLRISGLLLLSALPALAGFGFAAEKTWIQLCGSDVLSEPVHRSQHRREYLQIDGHRRVLELGDHPDPSCARLPVPVSRDEIRWFGLIPEAKAARLPRGVILQGLDTDDRIQVSEVVVTESPVGRRTALPLGVNLFSRLHPHAYGVETRAAVVLNADSLQLSCAPGERPAGIVLRNDSARLPEGIQSGLVLDYQADAAFGVGFADRVDHSLDDPLQLGVLAASNGNEQRREAQLPLPDPGGKAGSDPVARSTTAFTLMCPNKGGNVSLTGLQLSPLMAGATPVRSLWIWRPVEWLEHPEQLLDELEALSTPVVYISIPMEGDQVANAKPLARFIGAAYARGIQVWAVEGDPHAVLPEGQAAFARRAQALTRFNAGQPPSQRLSGVQYDIEPYLLPDFALHTVDWLAAYVQTISALSAALQIPVEIAVPFWWSNLELNDRPFLDALAHHVQSLNVMNYRTDPEQLQQLAEPFLSWGVEHEVAVRIALEAGPIQDEKRWHFRASQGPEDAGRLWHVQIGGEHVLVLLAAPSIIPDGIGYQYVRQSGFAGSRLTFKGDRARMDRVMTELESLWRAWPSFAGLALHEYRLHGE